MIKKVIKRTTGNLQDFDYDKIFKAVNKAFKACDLTEFPNKYVKNRIKKYLADLPEECPVETIQDAVEHCLMKEFPYEVAKAYMLYRAQHSESRFIKERIDYMDRYANSTENAASSSETDANANITSKNVATLESEVYKSNNRIIQRQRMKDKLNELYPNEGLGKQYIKDLEDNIIYTHDEASTPVLKQYCMAVSLYPLMLEGVGNIDGVTPTAPNDLQSFSGQITNLIFLLSSQCKGAVAVSEYFVALNYYVIAEFGPNWYNKLNVVINNEHCSKKRTIKNAILKAFKQFVWGINQPAGNRSFQSPFTNISYFDKTYFNAMFKDFVYPDNTKPEWEAVSTLQKMFMKWFNELRLTQIVAFPVETFAMVYDPETNDIIDEEYKDLCAEMYAEGHSFFTYISDSADSLASCCRLRNKLSENTFNPTSGLTGVETGSCNVITLNINRIIQDCYNQRKAMQESTWLDNNKVKRALVELHLKEILERVYKYHIAYKTMLYEQEDKKMFAASNGGYIHISKLYSTIGINGFNEAARFLGLEVSNNESYIEFLQLILGTIKEQNKLHSIEDRKRPFIFNSEAVPAENLSYKNYNLDKADGYWIPEDKNLYNSYFYDAHDPNTSVLDKFILHGRQTYQYTDGGSALHCNLENHLSKEQYLKLIDFAIKEGTSYFTFNIPNCKCEDCGHIVKRPISECPKCGSKDITSYTRVIGYLRPVRAFAKERQLEESTRVYAKV